MSESDLRWLLASAVGLLLAVIGYVVRDNLASNKEVVKLVTEIRVHLFGVNNDNGLTSEVKGLTRWRHDHASVHQRIALDIDRLQRHHGGGE